MKEGMTRKELLSRLARMGFALAGLEVLSMSDLLKLCRKAEAATPPMVVVARGGDIGLRLKRALQKLGGIEKFVPPGGRVIVKPNIGWARTPEQAANTNPKLVFALVWMCLEAGAKEVNVFEHSCDNFAVCFDLSGIREAVEGAGGRIYSADNYRMYARISVPRGKILKHADVVREVMKADCLINVPIAKVHNAVILTLGMKNLMGIIYDRGYWHRSGLDQCIADFLTVVRPHLTIVDAERILLTGGPKGPGRTRDLHKLIVAEDPVAADSYTTTLFGKKPEEIPYIRMAFEHGLGEMDPRRMKILEI